MSLSAQIGLKVGLPEKLPEGKLGADEHRPLLKLLHSVLLDVSPRPVALFPGIFAVCFSLAGCRFPVCGLMWLIASLAFTGAHRRRFADLCQLRARLPNTTGHPKLVLHLLCPSASAFCHQRSHPRILSERYDSIFVEHFCISCRRLREDEV